MSKEELAEELTKAIWQHSVLRREDIKDIISKKLKEILYKDKGRLHKGTLR